ncbi:hypothetical protein MNBD_GAMMA09-552 [hydrothermal vent metagenome]|uniref:PEP-CTERM protein-sorting domain-containing protein n=1 Tax=hydrothermal vent metagenome TaxID=652676 RepID=A0A3B0X5I5_9ZZZZ
MTHSQNTPPLHATYTEKLSRSATALSSLFLLPAAAQAAIVQNNSSLTISIDDARAFDYQPVDWDVDGNSVADFRLEAFRDIFYSSGGGGASYSYGNSIPVGRLELNSVGGLGMVQAVGANAGDISDLPAGTLVGPTLDAAFQWGPSVSKRTVMSSSSYNGFATGNLFTQGHLIGFSFLGNSNQTLYGWAQISLDEAALTMTIDNWAYEDSGAGIRVGAVPVPPSLLLMLSGLAMGAGGVLRGRKAREEARKNTGEAAI